MIKRHWLNHSAGYDTSQLEEDKEGDWVLYSDHLAEVEKLEAEICMPCAAVKAWAKKLTEQNKAMRLAIEHYLEVQKFLAAPDEDTCASSNDFRECLKGLK